jgi:hypothetical protein
MINDPTKRALRTFVQVGLVQALIALYNAFAPQPLTIAQISAITLVATPLVVLAQNLLEENGTIPSFGKTPPPVIPEPAKT